MLIACPDCQARGRMGEGTPGELRVCPRCKREVVAVEDRTFTLPLIPPEAMRIIIRNMLGDFGYYKRVADEIEEDDRNPKPPKPPRRRGKKLIYEPRTAPVPPSKSNRELAAERRAGKKGAAA